MASDDRSNKPGKSVVPEVANLGMMRPPFIYLSATRCWPVAAFRLARPVLTPRRERAPRGYCGACLIRTGLPRTCAQLARLLLADMSIWGRGGGTSVTNAVEQFIMAAHRRLIAGFGIALQTR